MSIASARWFAMRVETTYFNRSAMGDLTMQLSTGNTAEIWLYAEIGDDFDGISSQEFVRALDDLGKVDQITLRSNSPGVNVSAAVEIYTALRRHPARIDVEVDSLCASIATVIAMAGDTVAIAETAMWMVHNPMSFCVGNSKELNAMADLLDKVRDSTMVPAYSRTGKTPDQLRALLKAETWLSSKEAVKGGWADHISTNPGKSAQAKAKFNLSNFRYAPAALCASPDAVAEHRAAYEQRK